MGVRHNSSLYCRDRIFWNSKTVNSKDMAAFDANTHTAFQWFHVSKCFNNIRDNRTYAQVTKNSLLKQQNDQGIHSRYLRPRIVTVNNENVKVKPKIVTPSKVSINAQGCTSSHDTCKVKKRVSKHGVSPLAKQKGFLSNRFDVLANLPDSSINRYTEERVDEEMQPCKDFLVLPDNDNVQIPLKGTKNNVPAIQADKNTVKNMTQLSHHEILDNTLQCHHTEENPVDIPHAPHTRVTYAFFYGQNK